MFQVFNGRVPFQHPKTLKDTNLVRRWSESIDSPQYQHFFGTTTVIIRLDCNLTSVLSKRKKRIPKGLKMCQKTSFLPQIYHSGMRHKQNANCAGFLTSASLQF